MDFDTAIKLLYDSPQVNSKLLQYDNPQDLMQDALIKILNANREVVLELIKKGEIVPYFIKTIENVAKQKKVLNLCNELEIEVENENYVELNFNFENLEKKNYFYAKVLKIYLEEGSIRKVSKKTKVDKCAIYRYLKKIKKVIANEPEKYITTTTI